MSPPHRAARVRLALAALALAALPACGLPGFLKASPPEDGVTVKRLSADLAFGAEEAAQEQEAAAPSGGPAPVFDPIASLIDPFELLAPPDPPPQAGRPSPAPACRTATELDFPEEPATRLVKGTPEPGSYRWKQTGTFDIVGLAKLPVPPLTTRTVRTVAALLPDAIVAYEIEQTHPAGTETTTIEVRYSGRVATTDGIYLTRLRYRTPEVSIDFNPVPATAPKLFSLPIQREAVAASAVDLADGLALTVNGSVGDERHRLDACGEVVEAWKFSGTRLLQGLPPRDSDRIANTRWDLFVAPQLGAFIVGDHVVTHGSFGPIQYQSEVVSNIGGLKPERSP